MVERLFTCEHCSRRMEKGDLIEHIKTDHPEHAHDHACDLCTIEGFPTRQQLGTHRANAHGKRARGRPPGTGRRPLASATTESGPRVPLIDASPKGFVLLYHLIDAYGIRDSDGKLIAARYEQADGRVSSTVAMWLGLEDVTRTKWIYMSLAADGLIKRQTWPLGEEEPLEGEEHDARRTYAIELTPLALWLVERASRTTLAKNALRENPVNLAPPVLTLDEALRELEILRATMREQQEVIERLNRQNAEEIQERARILASRGQVVHTSEGPNWETKRLMEAAPGTHLP